MQRSRNIHPGIVVAGLRGGSGKTIISLGITAAWEHQKIKVAPFKKGPDYIDAGWLSKAAGRPCYNLDTYLCVQETVQASYHGHSMGTDLSVIEGNRGLYDGLDTDGSTSTAELAKLLNLPILLVLDCTKSTRTIAAVLMGCILFDPSIKIGGVILNRVAGKRHEKKIRDNIAHFCDVPVFGVVPKLKAKDFPERHMGLVTSEEHGFSDEAIEAARIIAEKYIDLDGLREHVLAWEGVHPSCKNIPPETEVPAVPDGLSESVEDEPLTIGIIRDSAFQFYYPDNIAALESLGAKIVYISPLNQDTIPRVHAIYMGGGFPETHAPQLAANESFRNNLRELAQSGLPIYAECGGLIFLGESICLKDQTYPMSGILPIRFGLSKRPQGHGYTEVEVVRDNPFYKKGEILRGHEFRYSQVLEVADENMAFSMTLGKGIVDKKDGLFKYNTFGTYTHIHALGSPSWAPCLVAKARAFRSGAL